MKQVIKVNFHLKLKFSGERDLFSLSLVLKRIFFLSPCVTNCISTFDVKILNLVQCCFLRIIAICFKFSITTSTVLFSMHHEWFLLFTFYRQFFLKIEQLKMSTSFNLGTALTTQYKAHNSMIRPNYKVKWGKVLATKILPPCSFSAEFWGLFDKIN